MQPDTEVALEDGIMIQVGDLLTTTQTDLAPLFEREGRKPREKNATPGQTAGASPALSAILPPRQPGNGAPQKHRSLNVLLGPSKGHSGRAAFPEQSPFELRQADQAREKEVLREAKRRKTQAEPWTVTKTTEPSQNIAKENTLNQKTKVLSRTVKPQKALNGQSKLSMRQVIDITSETEHMPMSDITVSSSPKPISTASRLNRTGTKSQTKIQQKPASTLPPAESRRQTSPPVSTKNRARHIDVEKAGIAKSPTKTPTALKTKQLRIGKTRPRAMLLCQKVVQSTSTVPQDKSVKRRRLNIYQGLSEDDTDVVMPEVQSRVGRGSVVPEPLDQINLQEALLNTASRRTTYENDLIPSAIEQRRPMSKDEDRVQRRGLVHGEIRVEPLGASHLLQTAREVARASPRRESGITEKGKPVARKSISIKAAGAKGKQYNSTVSHEKKEQGPWTVEAMDLFDWRPPDWEDRSKKKAVSCG